MANHKAPDRRPPLIGREVQVCPVTWRHTWGPLMAHVATAKSSCWLSFAPSMPTFIVKQGSGGWSQGCHSELQLKAGEMEQMSLMTSLLIFWFTLETSKFMLYLWYNFCCWICLGVWGVSQLKFITLITRAHTQRRTHSPQYSTVF